MDDRKGQALPALEAVTPFRRRFRALLRSVPTLGPGQTSAGTTTVVIPAGTARGSCFLITAADAGGAVGEADKTNNARSRAFTVR